MSPEEDPTRVVSAHIPRAQAVMEAGGEVPPTLTDAISNRIVMMLPGQVLEIVSMAPTATIDISSWCRHSGNELLGMLADGDETSFWIRKRE